MLFFVRIYSWNQRKRRRRGRESEIHLPTLSWILLESFWNPREERVWIGLYRKYSALFTKWDIKRCSGGCARIFKFYSFPSPPLNTPFSYDSSIFSRLLRKIQQNKKKIAEEARKDPLAQKAHFEGASRFTSLFFLFKASPHFPQCGVARSLSHFFHVFIFHLQFGATLISQLPLFYDSFVLARIFSGAHF